MPVVTPGPGTVIYAVFIVMTATLFVLSLPGGTFVADLSPGLNRAPVAFRVRLGALGGFLLPPAFGAIGRWGGMPQLAFLPLLALTAWSLLWLHVVVVRLRAERPLLDDKGRLPAQCTVTSPL